jgi:hypothetical protein
MDNSQEREWSSQELRDRVIAEQRALQAREYIHYCLDKNPKKPELAVIQRGQDEYAKHVAFYDANTLQYVARLHSAPQDPSPTCVAYSPGGKLLAIGGGSGCVRIVDCMNNQRREVGAYKLPHATAVEKLVWSPNDKQLAIAVATSQCLSYKTHVLDLSSGEMKGLSREPATHLQFHPTQLACLITLHTCGMTDNLLVNTLGLNTSCRCELNTDFQLPRKNLASFCISTDGKCCAYAGVDTINYACGICRKLKCGNMKIEKRGWIEFELKTKKLSARVACDLGESEGLLAPKLHYIDDMKQFVCCYGRNIALYTHEGTCTNSLYVWGDINGCAIVAKTPERITFAFILEKLTSTETSLEKVELIISKDQDAKASKSKLEKVKEFVCRRGWAQVKKKMGES